MEDVLFEWLFNYSSSYQTLTLLKKTIEEFVATEHKTGIPSFVYNYSNELSYQEPLYPLLAEIKSYERKVPSSIRAVFRRLAEDVRLFKDTPYHAYHNMIEIDRDSIISTVRSSVDFSTTAELDKLLEEYMETIRKTCDDIMVLFEKVKDIDISKYNKTELFNLVKNEWTNLNL